MNIKAYDGQDAFYSGTDEEYEEFLKNASANMDFEFDGTDSKPEPVDNTQRINLNETINLQNVIDKFKKTAGGIGQGAKALKDNVVSKVDKLKAKRAEAEAEAKAKAEQSTGEEENTADIPGEKPAASSEAEGISEKLTSSVESSVQKLEEIKGDMKAVADMPEKVDAKLNSANVAIASVSEQLDAITGQLEEIKAELSSEQDETELVSRNIADELKTVGMGISDIRQSVGSISKLNDSVFDLKNTQLNTKNAVANLELAFARLKKKCVLGITVVSILSAIIIALEVLLLLS